MMIPFNYEINVAEDTGKEHGRYKHYCKIELGDVLEETAIPKYKKLVELFGDGYKLTLTRVECMGKVIAESE